MKFGKIEKGVLLIAQAIPIERGGVILNPTIEQFKEYSYKELIFNEVPSITESQCVEEFYEETEDDIYISYRIKDV